MKEIGREREREKKKRKKKGKGEKIIKKLFVV
jgi:hypothetical protein